MPVSDKRMLMWISQGGNNGSGACTMGPSPHHVPMNIQRQTEMFSGHLLYPTSEIKWDDLGAVFYDFHSILVSVWLYLDVDPI